MKGSVSKLAGGLQGRGEQGGEGSLRNRQLIGRNRQAAFDDVKNALRGAAVALGIVQNSLRKAIRLQDTAKQKCRRSAAATSPARARAGPEETYWPGSCATPPGQTSFKVLSRNAWIRRSAGHCRFPSIMSFW